MGKDHTRSPHANTPGIGACVYLSPCVLCAYDHELVCKQAACVICGYYVRVHTYITMRVLSDACLCLGFCGLLTSFDCVESHIFFLVDTRQEGVC